MSFDHFDHNVSILILYPVSKPYRIRPRHAPDQDPVHQIPDGPRDQEDAAQVAAPALELDS